MIHVIDENDNAPIFLNEPITYHVSEATKIGVKLLPRISATDKDKSEQFSRIHYSIVPSLYSVRHIFDLKKVNTYFFKIESIFYKGFYTI